MNEDQESAALQKGTETYKNSNKNYDRPSKKSTCIKVSICLIILILILVLLGIGLYFLLRSDPNVPSLKVIPHASGLFSSDSSIEFDGENYQKWVKTIEEELEDYHDDDCVGSNCTRVDCNPQRPKPKGVQCRVSLKEIQRCNKNNNYGFSKKTPCIFLYLSGTSTWIPDLYNDTNNVPTEMPKKLKDHISNIPYIYNKTLQPSKKNMIWVSCEPSMTTTANDTGAISYYPSQGFPGYYYPEESENFLAPLVAVIMEKPALNKRIHLQCTAWAKNLHVTKDIEFEID